MTRHGDDGRGLAPSDAVRRRRASARRLALAWVLVWSLGAASSQAAAAAVDPVSPARCNVPDDTAIADAPLPRLARRMKSAEPLTVVVIGSGSAAGSGTSRKDAAFPARFEARFEARVDARLGARPDKRPARPRMQLVVLAETGQTAAISHDRIAKEVLPLKPALVIWQTGSADAARGVPVTDFGTALERGIAELREGGSDVVLIDSQFSPRASLLVNTDAYREAVRWNARRFDLPLFKRYDTMQYWWSHDVFDLDAEGKASQLENADRIHDCVAALLVRLIERGIGSGAKS